ncbi:MAG: biopolymer transporter ExbD [Trichlorobacter sp.]|jgi:biopolymer transport protein ExbD|nr:biopolymer transporter ExbD [Trichlorobacter sp.]
MDEKPFESMNVIPFVDIMLVLLTIVLTTSSFIATGRIPVNLPQASPDQASTSNAQIIELGPDGEIVFNGNVATPAALKTVLEPISKETPLMVRADRNIPLQQFIDVVDVLKQLNFTRVAVQTENR